MENMGKLKLLKGKNSEELCKIVLPPLFTFVVNSLVYWGAPLIVGTGRSHNLSGGLDELVPFMPAFIIIYFGCYIFWVDVYKRQISLIRKSHHGDKEAREQLVKENVGLVWCVVKRFYGRGAEPEDLFQIGSIGLLKAIDKFDLSYDVQFSTYAVPCLLYTSRCV